MEKTATPLRTRGEASVTLSGRVIKLRSSFQALASIEQALGVGIFPLVQRMAKGDVRMIDIATCIGEFAKEAGEKVNPVSLGAALFKEGYIKKAQGIIELLGEAVTAGNEEIEVDSKTEQKKETAL